ncbi:unnamed protein product [Protopolystoma xenopodis]|uniref:Uncharacterized protein n=1 Tax=Protopolystoma xenopodis TaxID=117903 RepID=A0A448WQS1_9PLAT|nr:unnamed protein product [Protopolystoma xenopodis]
MLAFRFTDFTRFQPQHTCTPGAISQTFRSTYKVASSTKCLDSVCEYSSLPSRIISSIKPVYPQQTVSIYFWSSAAHLITMLDFRDPIPLPSHVKLQPSKVEVVYSSRLHSLATSSLYFRNLFFLAIPFPLV